MLTLDHAAYPKTLKSKPIESLRFIIKDCQEAIRSNPENKSNGNYADVICYCSTEIHNRQLKGKQ